MQIGQVFDTDVETGCVVVDSAELDEYSLAHGAFLALDSDGVVCQFITKMVKGHADYEPLP